MCCPHQTQHGFSIPELLVAMGLSTVLLSTFIPLYRHWYVHLKSLQNRMMIIRQGVTVTGYLLESMQDFGRLPQYEGAFLCLKPRRQRTPQGERYTWFEPQPNVLGYLRERVNGVMGRIEVMPIDKIKQNIRVLLWDRRDGNCAIVQGVWTGSFLTNIRIQRFYGKQINAGAHVLEVKEHRYDLKGPRFYRIEKRHAVPFFGRDIHCRQQTSGVMCRSETDRLKVRSKERWFIALPRWSPDEGNGTRR